MIRFPLIFKVISFGVHHLKSHGSLVCDSGSLKKNNFLIFQLIFLIATINLDILKY